MEQKIIPSISIKFSFLTVMFLKAPLRRFISALLLLFFVLPAPANAGVTDFRGHPVFKLGYVGARNIVKGPGGNPVYAEIDQFGVVLQEIAEAVGEYDSAQVVSGDFYRDTFLRLDQLREQYVDDTVIAANGKVLSQISTGSTLYVSRKINLNLPDSVIINNQKYTSVLLSAAGNVLFKSQHNIAFRVAMFQLKDGTDAGPGHDGDIIRNPGDQLIGPMTGSVVGYSYYDGWRSSVSPSGLYAIQARIPPCPGFSYTTHSFIYVDLYYLSFNPREDQPIASWGLMQNTSDTCTGYGASGISNGIGSVNAVVSDSIMFNSTANIDYNHNFIVDLLLITGDGNILANSNSVFAPSVSVGDTTEYALNEVNYTSLDSVSNLNFNNTDINGDGELDSDAVAVPLRDEEGNIEQIAIYLNGRIPEYDNADPLTGQPINYDLIRQPDLLAEIAGEAVDKPEFLDQGLVVQISRTDLLDTDIQTFRASNDELISERTKLETNALKAADDSRLFGAGINPDGSIYFNTPVVWTDLSAYLGNRLFAAPETLHPEREYSDAVNPVDENKYPNAWRDQLRPGEIINTYMVNRSTGYIGKSSVQVETNSAQALLGTLSPPALLLPPNLKIRIERKKQGGRADDDTQYLVGFEGSGLTKDILIITTEWYAQDGSPLPDALHGYTARIAKVARNTGVDRLGEVALGDLVSQFSIVPGTHTENITLPEDGRSEHYYIHISGQPIERQPDFSALGGEGILGERPARYVPFRVPVYDEQATKIARAASASPEDVKPVYRWVYRPEMQFSIADLDIQDLTIKTAADEQTGQSITSLDLSHTLTESAFDPLTPIGAGHNYIFVLGDSEIKASINEEGVVTFDDVEQLARLQGEDILALDLVLVDEHDRGNILYEFSGIPLIRLVADTTTTSAVTSVLRTHYESVLSNNDNLAQSDYDDSYFKRSFVLSAKADVALVLKDHEGNAVSTLISKQNLAPGVVHHFALSYDDINISSISPRQDKYDYELELSAVATGQTNNTIITQQNVEFVGDIRKSVEGNMLGQIIQHDVLIQSGAISLHRQDLNLPGLGPDLSFSRSYSNRSSSTGDMGQGWSHNLDIVLTRSGVGRYETPGHVPEWLIDNTGRFFNGTVESSSEPSRINISNGGAFLKVGAQWVPQRGYHGSLTEVAGGFEYRSKDGTFYQFANMPGTTLHVNTIQDRNGNVLTYNYETIADTSSGRLRDRVTQIVDASGRSLDFTYSLESYGSRLTQVSGPDNISLDFSYDTNGNLSKVERGDAPDYNETYAYEDDLHDASWNLSSVTDANNHTTTYDYYNTGDIATSDQLRFFIPGYNEVDLVKSVTYADGGAPAFNYEVNTASVDERNRRQVTDARGNTTSYFLSSVGNPKRIEEPLGKNTLMSWSLDEGLADNVMTSRTDAEGRLWRYEYDTNGNVTLETDPDNNTTTSNWNQFSQLLTRTDRNGHTITNTYDAKGNLLMAQDAELNVTIHTYNDLGLRETTTSPRGDEHRTVYTYDTYGFLETEQKAEGSLSQFEYDIRGRLINKTDPNDNTTAFTYDSLDRLTQRTDPDAVSMTYDYDNKGNKTQEVTRQGITLDYTYDERDRVESAARSGSQISNGNKAYSYDLNGNLLTETDWKNSASRHVYDALNRREQTTNRDNEVMAYTYDLVGNKLTETDYENRQTSYLYDKLDRVTTLTQVSSAGNRVTTQAYDNEGNLSSVTDANNHTSQYQYDDRNLRTQQTNADNGVYQWGYDEAGNLVEEINENNISTNYAYDKQNRRTEMRSNDGANPDYLTQYAYDANGNVTGITDSRNNTSTTTYDSLNRPLVKTDSGNFVTNYSYADAGRTVTVTDARNIARITETDGLERIIRQTQGDTGVINNTYDANGNNTQINDARNSITAISYDVLDRPLSITEAQGSSATRVLQKEYDNVGNLTADVDGRNLRTEYTYNDFNEVITITDPAPFNSTRTLTYDNVGNKLSETDRRNNTTTFTYDDLNRLTIVTDPAPFSAQTTRTSYDSVGNRLTETDKRGTVTSHSYDDLNRLTQSSKPDGQGNTALLVRNEYDGNSNIIAITDANNNRSTLSYTSRNQLQSTTYADSTSSSRSYDPVGNLLTSTDEAAQVNTYTYDNENRLASDTNHAQESTAYSYDENGNRLSVTKPEQNGWSYTYDGLNRLQSATDSLGHSTTYEYDNNDNLVAQIDAESQRVEYTYDNLNRRSQHTQIKNTGNLTVNMGYDANGNLTTRTDAKAQTVTIAYDELNRETTRTYPVENGPFIDIRSITTGYDANNNPVTLTETKNQNGSTLSDVTSNTYDLLDRQLSSTQRGQVINYGYDNNGNRLSVSTAAGSTSYTYDTRNRLDTAVQDGQTSSYTYYADGKQQQITYPNNTQTGYIYDDADRITNILTETASNTQIAQFQYTYDSNGNRTQQQETQGSQTDTTTYTYDQADRMDSYSLNTATGDSSTTTYTFDNVSNRLTEVTTENAVETINKTYTYDDTHWLDSVTDNLQTADINYSYDNNGNTVQKVDNTQSPVESTVFIYNSRDQLVQTQRGPPGNETDVLGQYDYNYSGLRTRHYNSERGNVNYYYDDQSIIEERSDSNTLLAHYRYADRLISLQTPTETNYYHHDALGSTSNLTDASGASNVSYRLDPWGQIREQIGTSVNRQIFTGQETDEQTGLVYFGARFYDPDVGRFLNQDSYLGESNTPPSLHRYLYAYANPTYFVDPDGHAPTEAEQKAAQEWLNRQHEENSRFTDESNKSIAEFNAKQEEGIASGRIKSHEQAAEENRQAEIETKRQQEQQARITVEAHAPQSEEDKLRQELYGYRNQVGKTARGIAETSSQGATIVDAIVTPDATDLTSLAGGGVAGVIANKSRKAKKAIEASKRRHEKKLEKRKNGDFNERKQKRIEENERLRRERQNNDVESKYKPAPKTIPGIPGLKLSKRKTPVQGGGGLRKRWKDDKGNIYEWDSENGAVEKYNKRGKHLGEFNPATGKRTKSAKPGRKVEK